MTPRVLFTVTPKQPSYLEGDSESPQYCQMSGILFFFFFFFFFFPGQRSAFICLCCVTSASTQESKLIWRKRGNTRQGGGFAAVLITDRRSQSKAREQNCSSVLPGINGFLLGLDLILICYYLRVAFFFFKSHFQYQELLNLNAINIKVSMRENIIRQKSMHIQSCKIWPERREAASLHPQGCIMGQSDPVILQELSRSFCHLCAHALN